MQGPAGSARPARPRKGPALPASAPAWRSAGGPGVTGPGPAAAPPERPGAAPALYHGMVVEAGPPACKHGGRPGASRRPGLTPGPGTTEAAPVVARVSPSGRSLVPAAAGQWNHRTPQAAGSTQHTPGRGAEQGRASLSLTWPGPAIPAARRLSRKSRNGAGMEGEARRGGGRRGIRSGPPKGSRSPPPGRGEGGEGVITSCRSYTCHWYRRWTGLVVGRQARLTA